MLYFDVVLTEGVGSGTAYVRRDFVEATYMLGVTRRSWPAWPTECP